jgi:hypothetical protein
LCGGVRPEPCPRAAADRGEIARRCLVDLHCHILPNVDDGAFSLEESLGNGSQYFSPPGPRLVDSLEILAHALSPELHPLPAGLPAARRIEDSAIAVHRSLA